MKYKTIIVAISAVVAILAHLPEVISKFDPESWFLPFGKVGFADIVSEVVFLFLSLLLLFWLNAFIFHFRTPQQRVKWYLVVVSFMLTWTVNSMLGHLFVLGREHMGIPAIDDTLHHYLHPLWDAIISFVVTGSCYILHLVTHQQLITVENQELRTENLRNQYETLKNQLNPHMFFNSLNTLNTLIRESPEKAQEYTCELSKVLRYTLHTTQSEGVTLSEELEFVNGYIYLLKTRYEENLNFEIDIPDALLGRCLPPMAVQMLIENAVKHNEISNKRPLTIRIATQNGALLVSNPIHRKISDTSGEGIGLRNLNKRYELLFRRQMEILADAQNYTVVLPLIKPEDERVDCRR